MSLDVHDRNSVVMWAQLAADYNTITPAQKSTAWKNFLNFSIAEGETYLVIKQNFNELLRKFIEQGGTVSGADRLQTLLGALPKKFDMLRESCFAQMNVRPLITYGTECLT